MTYPARVAPPKHPAKFSEPIIDRLRILVQAERRRTEAERAGRPMYVLDPFAGVGRVHRLAHRPTARWAGIVTVGIEIEEGWAAAHADTICADAMDWMRYHASHGSLVDMIVTSPTYGNRLADHHNAQDGSTRRSYFHDYGQPLHPNNSATLHWGPAYWAFHAEAYRLMLGTLRPGGLLLLNVSDFYKGRQLVPAVAWHRGAAMGAGFVQAGRDSIVATSRLQGVGRTTDQAEADPDGPAATDARAPHEVILRLRRPDDA